MSEIIRGIRPDEHYAVLDLWEACFSVGRDFFKTYFEKDPWQKDEYTRVCEKDGRLVAAVQLCRRPVESKFGPLVMGGIANVGTLTECRGLGYSTRLLKSCIEIMERESFDFSVLYTGIHDFYTRLGWKTVQGMFLKGMASSVRDSGTTFAETSPAPEELAAVYEAFNAKRPIACARPLDFWGWAYYRLTKSRWLTVRESGKLVGYAALLSEPTRINIREIAWLPGYDDAARELAQGIASLAARDNAKELIAFAPAEPLLVSGLQEAGMEITPSEYICGMFRNISMDPTQYQDLCASMSSRQGVIWAADHF